MSTVSERMRKTRPNIKLWNKTGTADKLSTLEMELDAIIRIEPARLSEHILSYSSAVRRSKSCAEYYWGNQVTARM
jgi:hypothetical protein